jgi:hypothetical protein
MDPGCSSDVEDGGRWPGQEATQQLLDAQALEAAVRRPGEAGLLVGLRTVWFRLSSVSALVTFWLIACALSRSAGVAPTATIM